MIDDQGWDITWGNVYFESYEFSNFKGFFLNFSQLILQFLNVKNDFQNKQEGGLIARGHVDATWHSGPRGSATRAHAAPTRR